MATSSAWTIGVGVNLDTSSIQRQLNQAQRNLQPLNVNVDSGQVNQTTTNLNNLVTASNTATQATNDLTEATNDAQVSYQVYNSVLQESIRIISSMVEQTYELDGALTEFKKVSDLSGAALDDYVTKLTAMGNEVARTGKPKCQAPNVRMVNVH